MNKSILLLDTPNTCEDCDLLWHCHKYDDGLVINIKPDWCPLKPVPEKISDFDDIVKAESENAYEFGICMYNRGLNRGYNSCIERILK